MAGSSAVVLLSGGLDSAICLYRAIAEFDSVDAISVDYGQRHRVELASARAIASLSGVRLEEARISIDFGSSLLTGGSDSPVVPCRNLVLLSVAAAHAKSLGASTVVIGSNADDHDRFPDCRPAFNDASSQALSLAVGVEVWAPLQRLTKSQAIIDARLDDECWAALALSWSCYTPNAAGARAPIPCRRCLACETRAEAFRLAGASDPADR